MPDVLEYTGRNGFLSLRLFRRARTEAAGLMEQRRAYQRLYVKCVVEGSATGRRTWEARRAEYVARTGVATEAELEARVLRRYGEDAIVREEQQGPPDPSLLVEEEEAAEENINDGEGEGEELEIEITAVDRAIMEQHGMTQDEYVESLLDMAEEMTPSGQKLRVKLKVSEDGEEEEGQEDDDDDDDDDKGGAPVSVLAEDPALELEQEQEQEQDDEAGGDGDGDGEGEGEELYDIDGFLEEKMRDLDLFEFPALDAAGAAWWQKEAAYVCRRLVRAVDAELDVPTRVMDVRTWLGAKKARKSRSRSRSRSSSRSKPKSLGTMY
ncbi:hypothetical protein F5X96DRAFT_694681 [Biscogniauxia mediterranea]|nr:hypothetical protein F5X96DRAFT_694681 [Biscogniauxia mediterranea]